MERLGGIKRWEETGIADEKPGKRMERLEENEKPGKRMERLGRGWKDWEEDGKAKKRIKSLGRGRRGWDGGIVGWKENGKAVKREGWEGRKGGQANRLVKMMRMGMEILGRRRMKILGRGIGKGWQCRWKGWEG